MRHDDDIDLTHLDDDFAAAPAAGETLDGSPVPDGRYTVRVERVELTKARTSGNPMLKWHLRILGPVCAGRMLWRNNILMTRDNARWLKRDLHTCGLDLAKLSDLPSSLDALLDVGLEVQVKTKGDYTHVYLNRRVDLQTVRSAADDDVPF